jgi:hypothetical protein
VAEQQTDVPFDIKRAYWLYDVPEGKSRGGHAHKQLQQFLIAMSGSFTVTLDDGKQKKKYLLDKPCEGLLITQNTWADLANFSKGAVCLCLASELFDAEDYISDYDEFLDYLRQKQIVKDINVND